MLTACAPIDLRVGETTPPETDPLDVTLRPVGDITLEALTGGDANLGDPAIAAPDVAARPTPVGGTGKGLDPAPAAGLAAPATDLVVTTGLTGPAFTETEPCLAKEAAVGANNVEAGRVRTDGAGIPLEESVRSWAVVVADVVDVRDCAEDPAAGILPRTVPLRAFRSTEALPMLGFTPDELRAFPAFGAIPDGLPKPRPVPAVETSFVFGTAGKVGTVTGSSIGTLGKFFTAPTLGFRSVGFIAGAGAGFASFSFSFSFSFSAAFFPPPHTLLTIFMNPNLEVEGAAALAPPALFLAAAPPKLPLAADDRRFFSRLFRTAGESWSTLFPETGFAEVEGSSPSIVDIRARFVLRSGMEGGAVMCGGRVKILGAEVVDVEAVDSC